MISEMLDVNFSNEKNPSTCPDIWRNIGFFLYFAIFACLILFCAYLNTRIMVK